MWYKNIRAQNFLILAFSLFGIVGSAYVFNLKSELSFEERRQIETEIFSILVDYLTSYPKTNIDYIFISISGSDPSLEILNNFHDRKLTVEPISSSKIMFGFSAPVVHKSDISKRGIQIDLKILNKEPSGHVKVLTSFYQDKETKETYEYTLFKNDGIYRVNSVKRPERILFGQKL